jgi:hypothetical protein
MSASSWSAVKAMSWGAGGAGPAGVAVVCESDTLEEPVRSMTGSEEVGDKDDRCRVVGGWGACPTEAWAEGLEAAWLSSWGAMGAMGAEEGDGAPADPGRRCLGQPPVRRQHEAQRMGERAQPWEPRAQLPPQDVQMGCPLRDMREGGNEGFT